MYVCNNISNFIICTPLPINQKRERERERERERDNASPMSILLSILGEKEGCVDDKIEWTAMMR